MSLTEDKMTEDPILKVWLLEYDKLKAEQTQRIGFRDNLLYLTLSFNTD